MDISDRDFKYHLLPVKHFERKMLKQFENIRKNKTGKLHFLSNILRIFKLQNYLEFPLSKEHRSFLTKIRISAHSLNIETGRYNSTPYEQLFVNFVPHRLKMKNILYYIVLNTRISEKVTIHCSKVLELTMILSERFLTLRIYSKQNKFANFLKKQTIYVMHSSQEFGIWVRWGYHYQWEERGSFC